MYAFIINQKARIVKQKNNKPDPVPFLTAINTFRSDTTSLQNAYSHGTSGRSLCIGNVHALYVEAIHGGAAKTC